MFEICVASWDDELIEIKSCHVTVARQSGLAVEDGQLLVVKELRVRPVSVKETSVSTTCKIKWYRLEIISNNLECTSS